MMRVIKKDLVSPPLSVKEFTDNHLKDFLLGKSELKKEFNRRIKAELNQFYQDKCAYCESYIGPASASEVDHYRPTSKYRWLVFEWSNLLMVCKWCNAKKKDHFPLKNEKKRILFSQRQDFPVDCKSLLEIEEPLLLNPELDDPMEHLVFLPPDGQIACKNGSLKGKKTIDVCGLDRDGLKEEYKRLVEYFFYGIIKATIKVIRLIKADRGKFLADEGFRLTVFSVYCLIFDQMADLKDYSNKKGYSQLGWHLYEQFDTFFIERVSPGFQDAKKLIRKGFSLYKEGKLNG